MFFRLDFMGVFPGFILLGVPTSAPLRAQCFQYVELFCKTSVNVPNFGKILLNFHKNILFFSRGFVRFSQIFIGIQRNFNAGK